MAAAIEKNDDEITHDLKSLLSTQDRDFLIRNNGDEVKVSNIDGKIIGLYFSASWCGPCQQFTPSLVNVYKELSGKGDFEVVFISGDKSGESFGKYFSKMPWLAIPFSDSASLDRLNKLFQVDGIPHLVVVGKDGKVLSDDGVQLISDYGMDAYPFTAEKLNEIKEEEDAARRNQSLSTILITGSRDFLISNEGKRVLVSELEGTMVGLYFYSSTYGLCKEFTPKLVEMYKKLKAMGEKFEIVLISLDDDDEQSYKEGLEGMPFLAVPFGDKACQKLPRYFELSTLPTLVILGKDGKTLNPNVAELIEDHGILAYPFTPEKLEELKEIEKKRQESQTLESLLVSSERDFVIGKDGVKVPVSELVGKNILLYFSAHWCPPCQIFLPKLVKAYNEIKAKDSSFELIFISSDFDQDSFNKYFSTMPWLALPFGDHRKKTLSRIFKIFGIPSLVAIGPTGKTVTQEARDLIGAYGSDAYPFTEEHLKELEASMEEMAKQWPQKVKHRLHEKHELMLKRRRVYACDNCNEEGSGWSYYCEECDFDLHPKCALEKDEKEDDEKGESKEGEGWVCEGDVCRKP